MALRTRVKDVAIHLYEWILRRELSANTQVPKHVGVVLDGNRRWAREAGFTDVAHGHRAGARKILELLEWCADAKVEVVTLWMLSTDNLNRDIEELAPLLDIIADITDELAEDDKPWRVRHVGAIDMLPARHAERLTSAANKTKNRTGIQVNVAVAYGGRQEIADAVRKLLQAHAERGGTIEELAEVLDVDHIAEHLYTSGQPDPDLIIRTSGEQRLSGFMLWQSAHSEFWFCEAYWPGFRRTDFLRAMREYAKRHRRYGN